MNLKVHAVIAALAAVFLALGSAGPAGAAEKSTKTTKTPKAATTQPAPAQTQPVINVAAPAPQFNAITQGMAQLGVAKCLPRIQQFTNFLTANAQAGVLLFTDTTAPDRRMSSISFEIQAQNALTYASASFAPTEGANECGGMYEAVTYWNNNCNDVGSKAFGNFKRTNPLRQSIGTLEGGPYTKAYLIPAGQGCISVKKEMVF